MKKILVLGIKGMAGHVVFRHLQLLGNYEVFGVARSIEHTECVFNVDVSNLVELDRVIGQGFDVIINCIGILNKDAEDNPHKAVWFNSFFPHYLESVTKNTNTKVISISTDCVFSGKKGSYSENDIKEGEGFYAVSKALGEINNEKDLTIRTSIIGPELNTNGIGLFNWFMNQKGEINGYTSAIWSGVTTLELSKAIHYAIENPLTGIVHLTNGIPINKYDLLKMLNEIWNKKKLTIIAYNGKVVDKSLKLSERFNYQVPNYLQMLVDQHDWMVKFANLYKY
jgi:dTDP-4-dehydrorhamnose reductase